MTQQHPDLADEQAYIDHAYDCLGRRAVSAALRIRDLNEADLGGTFQARFERNAFDEALVKRLDDLELGNAALVFGRIDRYAEAPDHDSSASTSVVSPWPTTIASRSWSTGVRRSPSRSTAPPGVNRWGSPGGATSSSRAASLLGIEDELFGEGHLGLGHDEGLDGDGDGRRQRDRVCAGTRR